MRHTTNLSLSNKQIILNKQEQIFVTDLINFIATNKNREVFSVWFIFLLKLNKLSFTPTNGLVLAKNGDSGGQLNLTRGKINSSAEMR